MFLFIGLLSQWREMSGMDWSYLSLLLWMINMENLTGIYLFIDWQLAGSNVPWAFMSSEISTICLGEDSSKVKKERET